MTGPPFTIRPATAGDAEAVADVLSASYGRLMNRDYPAALLNRVVPLITRPRPELLTSGRYFIADADGAAAAVGGWSIDAPGTGAKVPGLGHIRFVATHPDHTRKGAAEAILKTIFAQARDQGVSAFDCLSTRTAVRFYEGLGFEALGEEALDLPGGLELPVIRMVRAV